jgi:hypothetical protein
MVFLPARESDRESSMSCHIDQSHSENLLYLTCMSFPTIGFRYRDRIEKREFSVILIIQIVCIKMAKHLDYQNSIMSEIVEFWDEYPGFRLNFAEN